MGDRYSPKERSLADLLRYSRTILQQKVEYDTGEEGTIDTELRDSLLPGRTGKFALVQSSWEVLPDGTRRFLSAIIYGK
jgi:hypothetical protein